MKVLTSLYIYFEAFIITLPSYKEVVMSETQLGNVDCLQYLSALFPPKSMLVHNPFNFNLLPHFLIPSLFQSLLLFVPLSVFIKSVTSAALYWSDFMELNCIICLKRSWPCLFSHWGTLHVILCA